MADDGAQYEVTLDLGVRGRWQTRTWAKDEFLAVARAVREAEKHLAYGWWPEAVTVVKTVV